MYRRAVAPIHAVAAALNSCEMFKFPRGNICECSTVGSVDSAVHINAQSVGSSSVHVELEANHIPCSPFAAQDLPFTLPITFV